MEAVMKSKFPYAKFAVLLSTCAAFSSPVRAAADSVTPVTELVQRFTNAQAAMDASTLAALTADNYIEVSPVGEVDPREKMLTFYVKDEKRVLPAMKVEDSTTRLLGETAVVIAKITYTQVVEGQPRAFSLRSTFVAEKIGGTWKLVSAQYTPIRPSRNPG
jgi:ketosteroid isomerase-like protein